MNQPGRVRIDSWLWAVRLYRSRSAAAQACLAGHVKLQGVRAKAASPLHPGDQIRALTPSGERTVVVVTLLTRRVGAAEAIQCYEDRTPPPVALVEQPSPVTRDRGAGRPTKRDRRELEKFLGRNDHPGAD